MSRSTRRRAALAAAPAALLALGVVAPQAHAAVAPTTEVLASQVVPGLASATRVGDVDPAKQVAVDVLLAPSATSSTTGLTPAQLEAHLYAPGDPLYHHFLDPAQYAAQYRTAPAATAAVVAFGTAHGLHLDGVNDMGDTVVLEGTAAQVEATFSTTLATYRAGGRTFTANTVAPTVPAGAGVLGVLGLTDLVHFTTAAHTGQSLCAGGVCTGATTPQDMWVAYDQPTGDPNAPGNADFGQGQAMGVIGEGQTTPVISDLRQFEKENGLPQIPVSVVNVPGTNGSTDYSDNSGLEEWDIDTQGSTGMAPDASSLTLYFGTGLDDASLVNAVDAWVGQANPPKQVNMSIDGCEGYPVPQGTTVSEDLVFQQGFDAALKRAVDEGLTLFNSSGDVGSGCPYLPTNTNGVAVQPGADGYPASSPDVVSVGGTVLYGTAGTGSGPITGRSLEYGWNFSGGGTSLDYAEPDYQKSSGLVTDAQPCVVDPATGQTYLQEGQTAPTACREVPDIAAQSGDVVTNGYAIVNAGSDTQGGGTSLASPMSMGMWARIQAASTQAGGNGFADPALYAAAAKGSTTTSYDPAGDFFDVGDTANGKTVVTNNGTNATHAGYDEVTGLGVMDVNHLLRDIDGNTVPVDNVLPTQPTGGTGGGSGGGGTTGPLPASQAACFPLFTGAAGSDDFNPGGAASGQQGANPQLDVVQGDLHAVQLDPTTHQPSTTGTTYLEAVLTIQDLSASAPKANGAPVAGSNNDYYLLWTYGGTTYFASASVDTAQSTVGTPSVTYGNGMLTGVGTSTQYSQSAGTGDFGTFTPGTNGTIDIYVPLSVANVGTTTPGAALTGTSAKVFVAVPGSVSPASSLQPADSAGPGNDYTLGEVCSANGKPGSDADPSATFGSPTPQLPEAPVVVAVPLVGGYVAWRIVRRRRRAA